MTVEMDYCGLVRDVDCATDGAPIITGPYRAMGSPAFPAVASMIYYYSLRLEAEGPRDVVGELQFLDASGKNLLRPAGIWKQSIPRGASEVRRALKLPGIKIARPGRYEFRMVVDGQEVGGSTLDCVLVDSERSAHG